jgi:SpoIID/LytB domain protein
MRRARVLSALALVAGAVQGLGAVAPVQAAADVQVVVDGHGNGHGIGMSQWGAYGYAVDSGWSAAQILDRYYSGTVAGTVALDTVLKVRLQNLDGAQTAVSVQTGELVVDGLGNAGWHSVLARETSAGHYSVWVRPDVVRCPSGDPAADPASSGWSLAINNSATTVSVHTLADSSAISDPTQLAAVCEPSGTVRWYRGTLTALNDPSGGNHTLSVLPVEQYLRTVIAMEMSPGWAAAGGGRGAQALQAQAVAARSYALANTGSSYYDTCDQSCQAYFGVAYQSAGGSVRQVDNPATDAAVVATAGVVRRVGVVAGAIALTMFSASNGGWSAVNSHPLTPFAAVQDDGDGTSLNPYHNWTVTLSGAAIAAKYPSIGSFVALNVLTRNGYGEWGGRVQTLSVIGTAGSVTVTGTAFRSAMGLRDTWFNPRGSATQAELCLGRVPPPVTAIAAAAPGAKFTPLEPRRLVDTRYGTGTVVAPMGAGCTLMVDPGLDPSVTAVAVNLTTDNTRSAGFITAYPCGIERPTASAVQTIGGRIVAGMAIVPLSADGTFCVYSHTPTDLVIDLFGSYAPGIGDGFQPVAPARVYDSVRTVNRTVVRVMVAGKKGVPVGATAAALTVHALSAVRPGFVTVFPCSGAVPTVSSVNASPNVAVTNHVQVQLSPSGEVCLYTNEPLRVELDVTGWFGAVADAQFYAIAPVRVADTRIGQGFGSIFSAGANRPITLAGSNGLPGAGTLRAVVAEVTAVGATRTGWLTVHTCAAVPPVSMVRYVAGANAATSVAVGDDASGRWCIAASTAVHVLIDVSGYFA